MNYNRAEWLAKRREYIGASEWAGVLGVSPYTSAYRIAAQKLGMIEPDDLDSVERVRWGTRLESAIVHGYAEDTGRDAHPNDAYTVRRHEDYPWLGCTLDAWQFAADREGNGVLQIKTAGAEKLAEWQDEAPVHYQVQLQAEMYVTGWQWGTLACLIGGNRLVWHDYERHEAFLAAALPKLMELNERLLRGELPPIDGPACLDVVKRLHPRDNGETVSLSDEVALWCIIRDEAAAIIKEQEKRRDEAEAHIRDAIGDATYGALGDGTRYSLKTQERREYVASASTFRVLRKMKGKE